MNARKVCKIARVEIVLLSTEPVFIHSRNFLLTYIFWNIKKQLFSFFKQISF